jgi:sRNA-binding carbon storage regulator CsrA
MLVLRRSFWEWVDVDGPVSIVVTECGSTYCRLGFIAAPNVTIMRREVTDRIAAAILAKVPLSVLERQLDREDNAHV